jgi:hypothetical protein
MPSVALSRWRRRPQVYRDEGAERNSEAHRLDSTVKSFLREVTA